MHIHSQADDHPSMFGDEAEEMEGIIELPPFLTVDCPHCKEKITVPFELLVAIVDSFSGTSGVKYGKCNTEPRNH